MSDVESTAPEDFQIPLPPASFTFLVLSLRAQAEMQLGLMQFDESDKEPNRTCRWRAIPSTCWPCLWRRPREICSWTSTAPGGESLTELRFRFVQVSDEVGQDAPQKA